MLVISFIEVVGQCIVSIPGCHFTCDPGGTVLATPTGFNSLPMCSPNIFQYIDAVSVFARVNMTLSVQFVDATLAVLYRFDERAEDGVLRPALVFVDHELTGDVVNQG